MKRLGPPAILRVASASCRVSTSSTVLPQPLERGDHLARGRRGCAPPAIGAELAPAREGGHHHGAEEAEHDLEDDHDRELHHAAILVAHVLADGEGDHAREEHHEGVHDALEQGHGHHVAVGDVRDLVAEDALDLVAVHALRSRPARDRDQGPRLGRAGGEGVHLGAVVVAHLGHRRQPGAAGPGRAPSRRGRAPADRACSGRSPGRPSSASPSRATGRARSASRPCPRRGRRPSAGRSRSRDAPRPRLSPSSCTRIEMVSITRMLVMRKSTMRLAQVMGTSVTR